jgi:hypothetical protein
MLREHILFMHFEQSGEIMLRRMLRFLVNMLLKSKMPKKIIRIYRLYDKTNICPYSIIIKKVERVPSNGLFFHSLSDILCLEGHFT